MILAKRRGSPADSAIKTCGSPAMFLVGPQGKVQFYADNVTVYPYEIYFKAKKISLVADKIRAAAQRLGSKFTAKTGKEAVVFVTLGFDPTLLYRYAEVLCAVIALDNNVVKRPKGYVQFEKFVSKW